MFSLWLLGVLLPSGDAVPSDAPFADRVDARVSPIALAPSDPRAFLSDLDAQDGKAVSIAWIGASALRISKLKAHAKHGARETFLPYEVAERMGQIEGRDVHVRMYFLLGGRLFDKYLSLLHGAWLQAPL